MAVRNTVNLYIDGRNQSSGLVMPITLGEFLDEQLDEATVSLRQIKRDNFPALSCAEMTIINDVYYSDPNEVSTSRQKTYNFIVAEDNAEEMPPHSGLYNHELYLIEVTKIAERVVVDSLTYTNDIGRNYTENAPYAEPVWE